MRPRPPRRPVPPHSRQARPPADSITVPIDPTNPRAGLEAAADLVARGQVGVWWVSHHEVCLHSEDALEPEKGETIADIRQWTLNHLLTAWLSISTLSLGSPPTLPE